jgi:flagellar biosynthesis anti-sigma factor FlgM
MKPGKGTKKARRKKRKPAPQEGAAPVLKSRPQAPRGDDLKEPRLVDQALEIIDQTPEVRWEKVEALKEAIRQGAYRPDSRKVAYRLILQLLLEHR